MTAPAADPVVDLADPWSLYRALLAPIPEDVRVLDARLGHWATILTDAGTLGMAMTYRGGPAVPVDARDVVGRPLSEVAGLVTSWNLELAALGAAALNAWYSTPERLDALGPDERGPGAGTFVGRRDDHFAGRKVAVVGHFGGIDRFRGEDFVVLERSPRGEDLPDPACEYVLPGADLALLTGSCLVNKTMPRLLTLSRTARTVLVGPTSPLAPEVFAGHVQEIAGAVVTDPEACLRKASLGLRGRDMGDCLEMYTLRLEP